MKVSERHIERRKSGLVGFARFLIWRCIVFAQICLNIETLDSKTRFNFKFVRVVSQSIHPKKVHCTFPPEKLVHFFLLKGVKPSLKRTLRTLVSTTFHHYDMLAKTRNRMATAITFSHEKDAGTRVRTTQLVMGKSRSLSRRFCIKI